MKILIYGAGAVGSLLGGFLATRHDVTLVGREEHVRAVETAGLHVEGARAFHARPHAITRVAGDEEAELAILSVRATQTTDAVEDLAAATRPGAVVLTVQNGLGNWETLRERLRDRCALAGPVTTGAMLKEPGHVVYAGIGGIVLGGKEEDLPYAERTAAVFRDVGVHAEAVPDVQGALWQKAIVNAAINPLSAITGLTNGQLAQDEALRERMRRVVEECLQVVARLGIALPEPDAFEVVMRVGRATASNRSSMQRALEQGRRTEVDAITGRIVAEAKRLRLAVPENEALLKSVHDLENRRVPPNPARP